MKCFLSGLEIPNGRVSKDHYWPKSKIPLGFYTEQRNIFPAHKALNCIKGALIPCEWEEQKFDLVYHAISNYNLKHVDKEFCKKALDNWETYKINPCKYCIMSQMCYGG